MIFKTTALTAAAIAACVWCASAQAAGTANRAWVSGHGADAPGCGSPATPCRSFQYAADNIVAAGGEIDVMDPAGYGAVTISNALSIVNDGVGTAGVQTASGNAITINAGPGDAVTLRGLNVDGLGSASNGIVFNSGASLTIVNCVTRHFTHISGNTTGYGVQIQPTSGSMSFLISNLITSDNGLYGIGFVPRGGGTTSARGVIDHVIASNNTIGILIDPLFVTGGTDTVAISNAIASNNSSVGIDIDNGTGPTVTVSVDSSNMSGNTTGIVGNDVTTVLLGRSVITANTLDGVVNGSASNAFYTYGDNRINTNGTDVTSPMNTLFKPQ